MIRKIVKIKGVGKFTDYSANGDVSLKKINIIHGENSKGKTTLTSVFRSLRGDDGNLVCARKTINSTSSQEVELRISGDTHPLIFKNGFWNKTVSGIEIFDVYFINENVYSGLEIDSDHKKCLHNFVLGDNGVNLAKDINDIKGKIEASNKSLSLLESQIQPHTKGLCSPEEFVKIIKDCSIDKKITDKEKEMKIAKSRKLIQESPELQKIQEISIGLDMVEVADLLKKTIGTIQSRYLKIVEEHKKHLGPDIEVEKWLKVGIDKIRDNKCPFCTQSLDGAKNIITAYGQFFNEEYNSLKDSIRSLLNHARSINIDLEIKERELLVSKNSEKHIFWKRYLKMSHQKGGLFKERIKLREAFQGLLTLLGRKWLSPLDIIDCNKCDELEGLLNETNKWIRNYNQEIEKYNQDINKIKGMPVGDLFQLSNELSILQVKKMRFENEIAELCSKYIREKKKQNELNGIKKEKQGELNQLIKNIFLKYGKSINRYLGKFGTDFSIEETKGGIYRGTSKEPYAEYTIRIANCDLSFEENEMNPCIKYSLGEGDKAALAFAFFLAKLEIDGNLDKKIVIFDDPLSSFDDNRKSATIEELGRLSKSAEQLIVLTHNPIIARELWQRIDKDTKCKTLHIVRKAESSWLEEYNIEEETAGIYFQNYKTLELFTKNGSSSQSELIKTAQCIRPLLEGYLRIKYPSSFKSKEWLGDFLNKIDLAQSDDCLSSIKPRVSELEALNNYSKKFHHDTNPNLASQTVIESELLTKTKETLNFIYQ